MTIQDESSMLVARALDPQPGERLTPVRLLAEKSTHIAERMNDEGKIVSLDLHEHKVKLIKTSSKTSEPYSH